MAMAADSSTSNNHSPRSPSATAGGSSSPQTVRRNLPSPWAQVVRGETESSSSLSAAAATVAPRSPSSSPPIAAATLTAAEPSASSSSSPDTAIPKPPAESCGSSTLAESSVDSNGNAVPPRKPAWNRPVNGVVEPVSVMGGAVSWPALSESTRPSSRSTPESSRPTSEGSSSASQAQVVNQQPTQRQGNANGNANANPNSNANHAPNRQRSMRYRGGFNHNNGGGSGQGGFSRGPPPPPPLPPPFPVFEMPFGNLVPPVVMDSSVRGSRPMGGAGPQPHAVNDHPSPRNSSRRGNFGPRPRGDGHNNYGGRREQDRRDNHMPQFVPPPAGFIPPPSPGTLPYGPLPLRPFPGPMAFDMASQVMYVSTLPPESFRGVPPIAQAPPQHMFYPVMDPNLPGMILNQIEYYFSDGNLVKDDFLRSNMDNEGWVSVSLIANFPRIAQMTSSVEFILDCMRASIAVEIQGDKLRRRDDWKKWIRIPARFTTDPASIPSVESTGDALANSIQTVSLNDATCSNNSNAILVDAQKDSDPSMHASTESAGLSEMANGEGTVGYVRSSQS